MLAAEVADDEAIARMRRAHAFLVLSHARARTLKIRLYTPNIVALPLTADMDATHILAIADPTADLATPLKGPFEAIRKDLPDAFAASVKLAKLAGLLPAAIVRQAGTGRHTVTVAVRDVLSYEKDAAASLKLVTRARLPLDGAEQTELVAFRADDGAPENFAILIGRRDRCLRGCIRNASPAICWARSNAIAVSNCAARCRPSPRPAAAYCFISRKRAAASA
jgi:GTP cyclohydrolase II